MPEVAYALTNMDTQPALTSLKPRPQVAKHLVLVSRGGLPCRQLIPHITLRTGHVHDGEEDRP